VVFSTNCYTLLFTVIQSHLISDNLTSFAVPLFMVVNGVVCVEKKKDKLDFRVINCGSTALVLVFPYHKPDSVGCSDSVDKVDDIFWCLTVFLLYT